MGGCGVPPLRSRDAGRTHKAAKRDDSAAFVPSRQVIPTVMMTDRRVPNLAFRLM